MNDLISVLVPVYNVEKYLPRCLDCIIHQTYSNIEIVLLDDGSTDRSGAICDEIASVDRRVRTFHQNNMGQAVARNKCIELAKGEYLVFVDSDDIVTPTYVENLHSLAQKYNCKISCSLLKTFYEGDIPMLVDHHHKEACLTSEQAVELMNYQEKLDTWPVCKLYHKSIFESGLRYPVGFIFEDFALTYLLFFECDKIAWCNRVDYYYLLRSDSTEGETFNEKKLNGALNVLRSMEEHKNLLLPIIKSYKCRMISFAYHLLLKMPSNYEKRYIFEQIIRRYRWTVLFDQNARKKTRIACLASFGGFRFVKLLFKLVDSRK